MTTAQESEYIHSIILHMAKQRYGLFDLTYGEEIFGYNDHEGRQIHARMLAEKLIVTHDGPGQSGASELTPFGVQVHRHTGAYRGYLAAQDLLKEQTKNQQQEQLELTRISTFSTRDAATSAKRSLWLTAASVLVAIVATYFAWQASQAQDALTVRLSHIERQLLKLRQEPRSSSVPSDKKPQNNIASKPLSK